MKRIILFTIGSVQNFITNSRKTIDLQNASNIISSLMVKIIKKINEEYKGEIILPYLEMENTKSDSSPLCPNYIIASYENEEPVGKELKEMVIEEFSDIVITFLEEKNLIIQIEEQLREDFIKQIKKQLQTALDIYWCDIPFNKEKNMCIEMLYKQLEAIKNTKVFDSLNEPEGEKCKLCGIRNALFFKQNKNGQLPYKRQRNYTYEKDNSISDTNIYEFIKNVKKINSDFCYRSREDRKDVIEKQFYIDLSNRDDELKYLLKDGECLCSVCIKKRIEKSSTEILSTAGYAIYDWLKRVDPADYLKKSIDIEDKNIHQEILNMWKESPLGVKQKLKEYNHKQIPQPPTFYCIYRMDIDNLGKRMRKEKYSKELSKIIYQFLKSFKKAMNDYKSVKIIYAGGDDLLALMSVEKSFVFAKKLAEIFEKEIQNSDYDDLTYSQGLFFAHYKSPFSEVLRLSRNMLEEVKHRYKNSIPEKNGTVISILTEGFSDQSVFFQNYSRLNLQEFEIVMDYFDKYSTYFHNTLGEQFLNLEDVEKLDVHMFLKMLFVEQRRLMKRSLIDSNLNDLEKRKRAKKLEEVENLLRDFIYDNCLYNDIVDLTNYFNLFAIIKKLNSQKSGDLNEL